MRSVGRWTCVLMVMCGVAVLAVTDAQAAVDTAFPWSDKMLDAPEPAPFAWAGSVAHYNGYLIYPAGTDGTDAALHAYDIATGQSMLLLDLAGQGFGFGPSGIMISDDGFLYFLDNGSTGNIYRVDLTKNWPLDYAGDVEALVTGALGSIFSLTQNPWTGTVWFASADFATTMYLYEINAAFNVATQAIAFTKPNMGGNGPIIFNGPNTVLYGESVWGGNGYFHLLDTAAGTVVSQGIYTFTGGLAGAAYGFDGQIYAATGAGQAVYTLLAGTMTQIAATTEGEAASLAFTGNRLILAERDAAGASSYFRLKRQTDYFTAQDLPAADPAPFTWSGSAVYYDGHLIYPAGTGGTDAALYAYDIATGQSVLLLDLAGQGFGFGPSGLMVGNNEFLYFLDNGTTGNIYRVDLTDNWPLDFAGDVETLVSGALGSIFCLTQNPWTDAVWFASADFATTMYLYEINAAFTVATQTIAFTKPNLGGNGPIIFDGPNTVLYGEGVWGGNGYFHLVDTDAGAIVTQDYYVFTGGLAAATYGYDGQIYAASGAGQAIYTLQAGTMTQVAATTGDAAGLTFGGNPLFIVERDAAGASTFTRTERGYTPFPLIDDDDDVCFIASVNASKDDIRAWTIGLVALILAAGAGIRMRRTN